MFFRIITAIFFSLVTSSVFANGYCDGRPTQAERDRCYAVNNQTYDYAGLARKAIALMNTNIKTIKAAQKIPQQDKQEFLNGIYQSQKNIDAGCKDDKCVTYSVARLNNRMVAFYNKYH